MIVPTSLFWDLGNTLLTIDRFALARQLGIRDLVGYPLLDHKRPSALFDKAMQLLRHIDTSSKDICKATAKGTPLPPVVCKWLAGDITQQAAEDYVSQPENNNAPKGFFSSKREERLVMALLKALTDPKTIASTLKTVHEGLTILKECSEQYDNNGTQQHTLFVLSNWDPYSFEVMKARQELDTLFKYFSSSRLIISGDIGHIKPDTAIYEYVLDTFKLDPASCILIDDQAENVAGAELIGMRGILLKDENYNDVRARLRAYKVLP